MPPTDPPRAPKRTVLPDFAGRSVTLPDSPESWRQLAVGTGPDILLLGLGPGKHERLPFVGECGGAIHWLDAPQTLEALAQADDFALPSPESNWLGSDPDQAVTLARHCRVFFYTPGLRLAPDFWSPLLARMELANLPPSMTKPGGAPGKSVWLPGNDSQLLHRELGAAFAELGFASIGGEPTEPTARGLLAAWSGRIPDLALSINFRGLDSEGRAFNLCRELGIPLAIWLVDNPWHLLSGIRLPWWRKSHLFITDDGFIEDLKKNGAVNVRHMPLAASNHMWRQSCGKGPLDAPIFVGRSAFPARDAFFRGARLDPKLESKALAILRENPERLALPDYHWWRARMANHPPWPGLAGRGPGLGADNCSALNRAAWLKAALPHDLRLVGDDGWHNLLPGAKVLPPVDYYGALPDLYNRAACVLNVTGLLLPASLNQRHFDVWAAGGLLLSDATPGLNIFPQELTAPITLRKPEDFGRALAGFSANSKMRGEVISAWQCHIRQKHLYTHRISSIMRDVGAL